jgi:hypothetical protein
MGIDDLFLLIFLLSIPAIVAGMIKPTWVVRFGEKRTRKRVLLIYGLVMAVSFWGFMTTTDYNEENITIGSSEQESEKQKIPTVSEKALKHAYEIMLDYERVRDVHATIDEEKKKITLAIQVDAATGEEYAKDLADSFIRALASGCVIYGENDLRSPTVNDLGELYDHYDLHVGVGTSGNHFIVQGVKVTSSPHITW